MSFITIVSSRYAVNAPASTDLWSDVVTDLNYLYANQNSPATAGLAPNVVNGSFELDVNTTIQPTGWLFTAGTGGSGQVTTGQYNDGSQSYLFVQGTTAGNTAGTLAGPYNQSNATQQYYVVSPSLSYTFTFMLYNNRTDIANTVQVNWYSNTQGFLSSTTVLTQATGGANIAWNAYSYVVTPPAGAYYATLFFNMGNNSSTPPGATGNTWVDGVSFSAYKPAQGGSSFTNSNSSTAFTVPSGIFSLKIGVHAGSIYPFPGSVLGYMSVIPGDTLTINNNYGTFNGHTYLCYVANNRTLNIMYINIDFGEIPGGNGVFYSSSLPIYNVPQSLITLEY